MENSFLEYRNTSGIESDSDKEVIDGSFVAETCPKNKKPIPNQTLFVAESEDSTTEDEYEEKMYIPKSVLRKSSVAESVMISSSDDDTNKKGSIRRESHTSSNRLVLSSSDEEEEEEQQVSPELIPRKRPPKLSASSTDSPLVRRNKKRVMHIDSDADNSIVTEHNQHNKLTCLKDTPLKITDDNSDKRKNSMAVDESVIDSEDDESDDDEEADSDKEENNKSFDKKTKAKKGKSDKSEVEDKGSEIASDDNTSDVNDSEDEGPDEDEMVMSRATRMSIMGVVPKHDDDTDDSDFIQTDESNLRSGIDSAGSNYSDLPAAIMTHNTPPKDNNDVPNDCDSSKLTCSPFSSPMLDITNELNNRKEPTNVLRSTLLISSHNDSMNDCNSHSEGLKNTVLKNLRNEKENVPKSDHDYGVKAVDDDDDVTIIDSKPEIIALSSDDEDEQVKPEKKSPRSSDPPTSSRRPAPKDNTLKPHLLPQSYPNQVVYVKKHVRENELSKLNGMKEDLHNIRYLLENMDVSTLPDGGVKLIERLTGLEEQVRVQGDKVANMLVEPDNPTVAMMKNDGFDNKANQGLSWEDIQKVSNAVQPRMFGKQAMSTHMAERNIILSSLDSLHKSLATRPPESERAPPPAALRASLMPHQAHALAWLRWRETQRPRAGVLADDMGLGKTITMIALVANDEQDRIDNQDDDDDDEPAKTKLVPGGTLVVCPASLLQQWKGEVERHCKPHSLSVTLHHGPTRASLPARLASARLVLTTYHLLQRDAEKNGVLMRIKWRRVILDEAHIVRNYKSATSAAVCALKASRRWALTGTPVQNKDLDLFALLKFMRCTPFDELPMWKKWIDNKSIGGQERLNMIMSCILLRRTKQQLQQRGQLNCLPERQQHLTEVSLTKDEMNVYQKVLVFSKTLFAQFLHQRAEKHSDGGPVSANQDTQYAKMHKKMIALQGAKPVKSHEILVLLLRLRQVCCHCGLIAAMLDAEGEGGGALSEGAGGGASEDLLDELNKLTLEDAKSGQPAEETDPGAAEEGTTVAEALRSVMSPNNPVFSLERRSSKIHAVMKCLEENVFKHPGHRAVVVSQWTGVLRLVERELRAARVRCVTLSGDVPVSARAPLVAALNDDRSDVRVMLLSLCAGGVGLNLCGANHLLLLDPHWNPQLEEQAQDRIYRVGQARPVHVYSQELDLLQTEREQMQELGNYSIRLEMSKFMCVDTVEQSIRKLQQAKLELAENVLTGAKNSNASKLTIEDLKMLFNMGQTHD